VIVRIRLVVLLLRFPVAALLALFAALGLAAVGATGDVTAAAVTAVAVGGFLLFSVAVNDISDAQIDRVNLAGDRRRPLLDGATPRHDLAMCGGIGAIAALAVSAAVSLPLLVTITAGLVVSASYSLRPVRLADRGALAPLVLPSCYVGVPFLGAIFAAGAMPSRPDLLTFGGLYLAFLGRIVLKDFRDVRGDALFGKRTFLVRHGRRATCGFSAAFLVAGTAVLTAAAGSFGYTAAAWSLTAAVLVLLWSLSGEQDVRREERTIAAIAILGRGSLVALLAQQCVTARHLSPLLFAGVPLAIAGLAGAQALIMFRHGARPPRLLAPAEELAAAAGGDGGGRGGGAVPPVGLEPTLEPF
jgi:4-hydroxybenzoate polyprenyltransferase